MKDWQKAEELVKTITGGKITPGSGNGNKKGDVWADGWAFEVKQTSGESLGLKRKWFTRLSNQHKDKDVCLVIFFDLRGTPYFREKCSHDENIVWESKSVKEDDLPDKIYAEKGYVWVKGQWQDLVDL